MIYYIYSVTRDAWLQDDAGEWGSFFSAFSHSSQEFTESLRQIATEEKEISFTLGRID